MVDPVFETQIPKPVGVGMGEALSHFTPQYWLKVKLSGVWQVPNGSAGQAWVIALLHWAEDVSIEEPPSQFVTPELIVGVENTKASVELAHTA